MDNLLTAKDERYDELFDAEHDAAAMGTALIPDPYPVWKELAARGSVLEGSLTELMGHPPHVAGHFYQPGTLTYSVFSFNAVTEGLTNPDRFSSEFYIDMGIHGQFGDSMLSMDGPRHRAYRDIVQPFFQPAAASGWWTEKVIAEMVEELISSIEKKGESDLNADFFSRLPMHVVTAGFGVSPEEGLSFRSHFHSGLMPTSTQEEREKHMEIAVGILTEVVKKRQKAPAEDMISRMLQGKLKLPDGTTRSPTVEEVVDFCRVTMTAGGGTTWRQLGITIFALLNDPEQFELVKNDRKLLPYAILESARWNANDPMFPRKVMRDTVLDGTPVKAGATLHLVLGSANRDPTRWEDPDRYDVRRKVQRSTAFAAGPHSCLGQHVARQEMLLAINAIFDRLPNLRWDPNKPAAALAGGLIGRGPGALNVVFG